MEEGLVPGTLFEGPIACSRGVALPGRSPWEREVRESLTWVHSVPGSYAHALDGLYRVAREEGLKKLFSGATMASSRGMLVTVGQVGLLRRGFWGIPGGLALPLPSKRSQRKAVALDCRWALGT